MLIIKKKNNIFSYESDDSPRAKHYENVISKIINPEVIQKDIITLSTLDQDNGTDLIHSKDMKGDSKGVLCPMWALCESASINKVLTNTADFSVKKMKAIWRGSTTGQDSLYADKELNKFTRLRLIELSKMYPDKLNAKFTKYVQYVEKFPEKFRAYDTKIDPKDNTLSPYEQAFYKYIVIADGNVATYGLYWALASGSVVLKQDSDQIMFIEEGSDAIVPYVHYVPIKKDFSDLIEKIDWLISSDAEAKKIAKNALMYAKKHFTLENLTSKMITSMNH
jgi:hypothetical protein